MNRINPKKKNLKNQRGPKGLLVKMQGLAELRMEKGYATQQQLADVSGLSLDRIQDIENGLKRVEAGRPEKRVNVGSIKIYGSHVGLSVEELTTGRSRGSEPASENPDSIGSWHVRVTGPWSPLTASGLQWQILELEHKHVPGRKARGKVYDLKPHTARSTLADIRHWLTRHAEVSDRVAKLSGHISRNIDCIYEERRPHEWCVIDEWIEGISLKETLARGPLERAQAVHLMREVAEVLEILHAAGLVYRVLAPHSIFLTARGAVVTDFEMTKIAESGLTVWPSQQYPQLDVFVAREIRHREKQPPSVDLFSWAMILANAISGRIPEGTDSAINTIRHSGLPSDVVEFAIECLGGKSSRPTSFSKLFGRNAK